MTRTEIVRAFIRALEAQQWDAAAVHLAEDFIATFRGPATQTTDRAAFLRSERALQEAVPDWCFNLHIAREQGNVVWGSVHITGTHTRPFTPPVPDAETLEPTGKAIALPGMSVTFTFNGDLIAVLAVDMPAEQPLTPIFESVPKMRPPRPMHRRFSIEEIVRAAPFTVYGLDGSAFDLTLQGYSHMGTPIVEPDTDEPLGIASCGWHFVSPTESYPPARTFNVNTSDAQAQHLAPQSAHALDWTAYPAGTPIYDEDARPYSRFATSADLRAATNATPPFLVDALPLAGAAFAARIQFWTRPTPEWQVHLHGAAERLAAERLAAERLYVSATGVAQAELLDLIEHLIPINDRPDLIAGYMAQADAWRRFFRDHPPTEERRLP